MVIPFFFVVPIVLFVAGRDMARRNRATTCVWSTTDEPITTLEVCLSPGCLADGAETTLRQLQALAPHHVSVQPGVCCSLCGNGPIVLEQGNNNKKHRRVTTPDKLLSILFGNDENDETMLTNDVQVVVDSLQLIAKAQEAYAARKPDEAAALFAQGVETGFDAAQRLHQQRKLESNDDNNDDGLQWIVQARVGETRARLDMNDVEGAVRAAEAGLKSAPQSLELIELWHQACQTKGDEAGELKALQTFFDAPVPEKQTTMQANKRRQLGFRLAKLERELQ